LKQQLTLFQRCRLVKYWLVFNHLALNVISTLFQHWNNDWHYFEHISTLKVGRVPAGFVVSL